MNRLNRAKEDQESSGFEQKTGTCCVQMNQDLRRTGRKTETAASVRSPTTPVTHLSGQCLDGRKKLPMELEHKPEWHCKIYISKKFLNLNIGWGHQVGVRNRQWRGRWEKGDLEWGQCTNLLREVVSRSCPGSLAAVTRSGVWRHSCLGWYAADGPSRFRSVRVPRCPSILREQLH